MATTHNCIKMDRYLNWRTMSTQGYQSMNKVCCFPALRKWRFSLASLYGQCFFKGHLLFGNWSVYEILWHPYLKRDWMWRCGWCSPVLSSCEIIWTFTLWVPKCSRLKKYLKVQGTFTGRKIIWVLQHCSEQNIIFYFELKRKDKIPPSLCLQHCVANNQHLC